MPGRVKARSRNRYLLSRKIFGRPGNCGSAQAALTELAPQREHVLGLAVQDQAEAAAYMEANNIITIHKAQAELDELIEIADKKADALIMNLRAAQTKFIVVLSVLGLASVLVSVLLESISPAALPDRLRNWNLQPGRWSRDI